MREVQTVRGAVSAEHAQMLVSVPPHLAPAKLVQYIKGRSSQRLQEEFPHLKKQLCGQQLWARGYFCAMLGAVNEETVCAYIESQKWDADVEGFQVVAPESP